MAFVKKFYANSGALFPVKTKKSEKAPDVTGSIDLGLETIDYIIAQHKAGNLEISIELSGWKKVSRAGNKFISLQNRKPMDKKDSPPEAARAGSFDDDEVPF